MPTARGRGAGGVLGFVAADSVSEGVFGDGPGAVEGVAVGRAGEERGGAGYALASQRSAFSALGALS